MRKRTRLVGDVDVTVRAVVEVEYVSGTCRYTDPGDIEFNQVVEIRDADTDIVVNSMEDLIDLISDRATIDPIDWEE